MTSESVADPRSAEAGGGALSREEAECVLERARRILSGENTEPALETPTEVTAIVEHLLQGRTVTPEARQRISDDFTLQFHCGGREVACLRRPGSLVVLARGQQEVELLLRHLHPEQRRNVVIEHPDPW